MTLAAREAISPAATAAASSRCAGGTWPSGESRPGQQGLGEGEPAAGLRGADPQPGPQELRGVPVPVVRRHPGLPGGHGGRGGQDGASAAVARQPPSRPQPCRWCRRALRSRIRRSPSRPGSPASRWSTTWRPRQTKPRRRPWTVSWSGPRRRPRPAAGTPACARTPRHVRRSPTRPGIPTIPRPPPPSHSPPATPPGRRPNRPHRPSPRRRPNRHAVHTGLLDRGCAPVRVLERNEIPDGFHNPTISKGCDIISPAHGAGRRATDSWPPRLPAHGPGRAHRFVPDRAWPRTRGRPNCVWTPGEKSTDSGGPATSIPAARTS